MEQNKILNYLLLILIIISFYILPFGSLDFQFCIGVLLIFTLISLLIIVNKNYIQSIGFNLSKNMLISLNLLKNNLKEVYNLSYIKKNKNYLYIIMFFIIMVLVFKFVSDEQKGFLVGFSISFWLYIISHNLFNKSGNGFVSYIKLFLIRAAKLVIAITLIVLILYSLIYFNLLDSLIVYCQGGDEVAVSSVSNSGIVEQINQTTTTTAPSEAKQTKEDSYNVNLELNKELVDNTYSIIKDVVTQGIDKSIEKIASNTGAGAAAGSAAAAVLKSNLPPVQKLVMTGAAAGITAATTKLGMDFSSAMIKNRIENDKILNKMDPDRIPSPDNTFICSLIDKIENVTPLEQLIHIQLLINIILIISIFLFVLLLFNKLFWSSFSSTLGALELTQQSQREQSKTKLYLNKLRIFTQNYFYIIFIILTIQVLILLFFNIVISSELTINLEDYIRVYNHIKGKG